MATSGPINFPYLKPSFFAFGDPFLHLEIHLLFSQSLDFTFLVSFLSQVFACPAPTSKMVALHCGGGLRPLMLSWSRDLPCIWRALHTSAVCFKVSAAWGLAASGSGTWGWGHDLGLVLGQWSRKVTASLFRTGRPESEWARGTNQ